MWIVAFRAYTELLFPFLLPVRLVTWSVLHAGCHSEILQPASCALTCLTLADVFLIVLYNFCQISFGYRLLFFTLLTDFTTSSTSSETDAFFLRS